ncbi:hypothetical protein ACIA78_11345 [Streptomyces xanthochromogenes]|uniref:DUF7919 family protein n=2 Tax=Streptomyces xanthochromogenes TaxID=67384 RepID=UPI0037950E1D
MTYLQPTMGPVHIAICRDRCDPLRQESIMTYFPDLSPYTYEPSERGTVNVGWLSSRHEYQKGLVADVVVDALKVLCAHPENQMRGYHRCDFCQALGPSVPGGDRGPKELFLGSAEVHVEGTDGIVYAAPTLVLHYIMEHQYCPPREFCEAAVHQAGLGVDDELTAPE